MLYAVLVPPFSFKKIEQNSKAMAQLLNKKKINIPQVLGIVKKTM